MATKRRIAFSAVARPADFGVGKWSRIATYGLKAQRQPDGSFAQTLFDDEKFGQWLKNFRLMFASRGKGMGSDYEHQTMHAAKNGQPAQNLAYFTALAWVRNGELAGLETLRDGIAPIDPSAERARLAAEYPKADSSPDGVWAYCSEVTELGRSLIPNYSQLSPLFNDSENLEDGEPIDSALLNISFVNIAHQTGTNFAFGKRTQMTLPDELRKKLSAFGLTGDAPSAEELKKALGAYMEQTDDDKTLRAAMAKACAQALGDLEVVHKDDDDGEKTGMSKHAENLAKTLAAQTAERQALAKQVEVLQAKEAARELAELTAEAKARGLTEMDAGEYLKGFGKTRALEMIRKFPLTNASALGKWNVGRGTQSQTDTSVGAVEQVNGVKVIGRGLAKAARELLETGKAKTIAEAQRMAFAKAPNLYTN